MRPINTILFPTDYSEGSEYAFYLASELAMARGARLLVVHVVEPPVYTGEFATPPPPVEAFRDRVDEWLKECRLPGRLQHIESRVVEGFAWEEIVRAAQDSRCDLIVMRSEGKTGIGRTLLGSVAERVARQAPCPVLICKEAQGKGIDVPTQTALSLFPTILVPSDLSDRSQEAFSVAMSLAGLGSRLIVQHVITAVEHASPEARSAVLKRLHDLYPASNSVSMVYRLSGGEPVEEIRRAAEDTHCNLVVMSSHGRKGVNRLLMGSVAESVFRAVSVSVLIVHSARPETVPGDEATPESARLSVVLL